MSFDGKIERLFFSRIFRQLEAFPDTVELSYHFSFLQVLNLAISGLKCHRFTFCPVQQMSRNDRLYQNHFVAAGAFL